MPFNLLDGYAFHIVCRYGVSAQTPAMQMGELGFDTDTRVLRVGNDTAIPESIMATNSTVAFVYPNVPSVTFNQINLPPGGTVDGVDISTLTSTGAGLLASDGAGTFNSAILTSGDNSLTITNPSGQSGNPDIRISPAVLSGFLTQVYHTTSFTGTGAVSDPLALVQGSTTVVGGLYLASSAEAIAGVNPNKAITPATLKAAVTATAPTYTEAPTAPASPKAGDLWWCTSTERLSIFVSTGNVGWIDISS